jgi:pimeloyl-ACP methyl ester carboxylesterase
MKQLSQRLMLCAAILTLVMVACSAPVTTSQQATQTPVSPVGGPTPTPIPLGMVDVGGYELFFQCVGEGTPTVILEAGADGGAGYWVKVQSSGDRSYRVCSYDRANIPSSGKAPKPRTYLDMARDLHALLVNAHIGGPYILVGHSGGGLLVRVFADQYPEEVVGLVLVDSAHPDMGARLLAGLPPKSAFEPKAIREWRIWLSWMDDSHGSLYRDREGLDTKVSNAQVKAAKPLGDLPLVVISRSPDNPTLEGRLPLPAETNVKLRQIWQDLQNELVGLSSNSTHIIAAHAGHMIPTEEPELVIDAIRKLVNEARSQMGDVISPADQTKVARHAPVILRVVERTENEDGRLIVHKDITFTDAEGDAMAVVNKVVSYDLGAYHPYASNDVILESSDEQRDEAFATVTWSNPSSTIVYETRILDRAGNLSEPVILTFTCPARQRNISPMLIIGLVAGLGLLTVVAWLLVRYRRSRRATASPARI